VTWKGNHKFPAGPKQYADYSDIYRDVKEAWETAIQASFILSPIFGMRCLLHWEAAMREARLREFGVDGLRELRH
jgi:hypothetical protein